MPSLHGEILFQIIIFGYPCEKPWGCWFLVFVHKFGWNLSVTGDPLMGSGRGSLSFGNCDTKPTKKTCVSMNYTLDTWTFWTQKWRFGVWFRWFSLFNWVIFRFQPSIFKGVDWKQVAPSSCVSPIIPDFGGGEVNSLRRFLDVISWDVRMHPSRMQS